MEKKSWANLVASASAEDDDRKRLSHAASDKHERSSSFTCASNFSRDTRRWGSRSPSPEPNPPPPVGSAARKLKMGLTKHPTTASTSSLSSTVSPQQDPLPRPSSPSLAPESVIKIETSATPEDSDALAPSLSPLPKPIPSRFLFNSTSSCPRTPPPRTPRVVSGSDDDSNSLSLGRRTLDFLHSNLKASLDLALEACQAPGNSEQCISLTELLQHYLPQFERLASSLQPAVKTTNGGAEILVPKWDVKPPTSIVSPSRIQSRLPPVEREILEQRIAEKQIKAEKLRGDRETQLMMKAQVRDTRIKEASDRVTQKLDRVRSSTADRHGKAEQAREDHLNQIRIKAGLETAKVKEVAFIASMTELMKSNSLRKQLDQRLIEGEARHKQQLLLRQQPAQAATKWAEAVIDKRKAMDEEIKQKGSDLDSKQKAAELRRQKIKDDGLAVVVPEIRWCVICKVKLLTTEYVERHLAGKKHLCELEAAGTAPSQIIVPFVEETPVVSEFMAPVNMKAKKKKARKLKKLMVADPKPSTLVLQGATNTPLKLQVEYLLKAQATAHPTSDSDEDKKPKHAKKEEFQPSLKSLREIQSSLEQESTGSGSSIQVYTALADVIIPTLIASNEDSKTVTTAFKIVLLLCKKSEVCQHVVQQRRTMVALVDALKQRVSSGQSLTELCTILRLVLCAGGDSASLSLTLRYVAVSGLLHQLSAFFIQASTVDSKDKPKKPTNAQASVKSNASSKLYPLVQLLAALSGLPELVTARGPVFEARASDVGQVLVGVLKETSFAGLLSVMEAVALRPTANRRVEQDLDLFDEIEVKTLEEALQTLNHIGRVDMLLLQRFASENQIQLYHIVGLLLRYCTEHFEESTALLHQLLLFVGYCTVLNLPNQAAYRWGKAPILLQRLCNLPFVFFLHDEHRLVLLPTLIACCFRDEANLTILKSEINVGHCVEFIKQSITEGSRTASSAFDFDQRFPRHLWQEAVDFFQQLESGT